jgi:hypothetical protein
MPGTAETAETNPTSHAGHDRMMFTNLRGAGD